MDEAKGKNGKTSQTNQTGKTVDAANFPDTTKLKDLPIFCEYVDHLHNALKPNQEPGITSKSLQKAFNLLNPSRRVDKVVDEEASEKEEELHSLVWTCCTDLHFKTTGTEKGKTRNWVARCTCKFCDKICNGRNIYDHLRDDHNILAENIQPGHDSDDEEMMKIDWSIDE